MTLVHDDLMAVIESVEILSPDRYVLLGELHDAGDRAAAITRPADAPIRLTEMLASALYERLYVRPSPPPPTRSDELSRRDLLAALSAANAGRGHWESGWSVRRIAEDGRIVVARGDVAFWAPAAGVRVRGAAIRPGDRCRVRVPKEMRGAADGFYVALGDAEDDADEAEVLLRYYWHVKRDAAASLVAGATSLLNASGVPFRLKVPRDPDAYRRADAGVLYSRPRHRARIEPVIARIHASVASGLRPTVPLFTRRLADGLGFAEGPIHPISFGDHRCRLVAGALWESFERGEGGRETRAATVASAFLREGLDPLRPHLARGGRDADLEPARTSWAVASTGVVPRIRGIDIAGAADRAGMPPIDAAARIGWSLCRAAYWDCDGEFCNWMGRSTAELAGPGRPIAPASSAVGPDLYGGSSGIALFLAQLHELCGVAEFRRAALGGIARSIDRFGRSPARSPLSPLSFFSGDLGAAYAARRVAALIGHPDLRSCAEIVLRRAVESSARPQLLDVIGGHAGAIPALRELGCKPGWGRCRDLAILLGEDLCRAEARRTSGADGEPGLGHDGFAWSGLAHGAAGIGLALLELHSATSRVDFRDAARRSFEREDRLFDARQGNWANSRPTSVVPRFEVGWCRGAPGIALARLRAAALDPGRRESYLAVARIGIASTVDAIENLLAIPRYDATACHGLAGLIEILWIAARMLDDASYRDRALAAARVLIDRYAESGDWPSCLDSGGPDPSLMLGTAGIGYTFLRLHDPDRVPSVLWIGC